MLPAVTNLEQVSQDPSTGATVFTWDAVTEADLYELLIDGVSEGTTSLLTATVSLAPGNHTFGVAPVANPTAAATVPFTVATPVAGVHGIFVFTPTGGSATAAEAIVSAVLGGPFPDVQGFDWLAGWSTLETAVGVYDWTVLDAAINAAAAKGKLSQICMLPGFEEPAWLLALCPTVPVVIGTGPATICVPTNTVFLNHLKQLIGAMGVHYANNPNVISIQTSGLGAQGEMILKAPSDGTSWASHGVTTATLLPAWEEVMGWWATAFPNKQLNLAIDECIFANVDGDVKSDVLAPLIAYCETTFGDQVMLQQNGLSSTTSEAATAYWSMLKAAAAYTTVGWQMFESGDTAANLKTAFGIGLAALASYFQVYAADIETAANAPSLQYLATALGV